MCLLFFIHLITIFFVIIYLPFLSLIYFLFFIKMFCYKNVLFQFLLIMTTKFHVFRKRN